jgi:hypothetical protein
MIYSGCLLIYLIIIYKLCYDLSVLSFESYYIKILPDEIDEE